MNLRGYPLKSLRHNVGRTVLLASLVAVLGAALFAGTAITASLRRGLGSLQSRLGADVIVAPQTASSTIDLNELLVDGVPGNFYMDRSSVERVAAVAGVERVSPQYYLATAKAGCCTAPLQIIGIDPATDFAVQPWIARSYGNTLGFRDVVAGCNVSGAPGTSITFYGHPCTIVAKLDKTGTALDNAVFCDADTVKDLIVGSVEQGMSVLANTSPDSVVSTVQVRVAEGVSPESVADDINLHVRGVRAVAARALTAGVADGMAGVSAAVGVLVAAMWAIACLVLVAVFVAVARQRRREFAVLRIAGAPRRSLVGVVVAEAAVISAAGAATGVVLAAATLSLFNDAIEAALGLPYLMPAPASLGATAVAVALVALIAGCAASAVCAVMLSRVDAAQALREE